MIRSIAVAVIVLTASTSQCKGGQAEYWGPGDYRVGSEIPNGTYHTAGNRRRPCFWTKVPFHGAPVTGGGVGSQTFSVTSRTKRVVLRGDCSWRKL